MGSVSVWLLPMDVKFLQAEEKKVEKNFLYLLNYDTKDNWLHA